MDHAEKGRLEHATALMKRDDPIPFLAPDIV
jgi:hypothetical protein